MIKAALIFIFVTSPVVLMAQVEPSAFGASSAFSVGGGFSNFNTDVDGRRMSGGTLWGDYQLQSSRSFLHGVGLEAEARDLLLGKAPSGLAEKTFGGGVTYTWRHYQNFHPYGKLLFEYGTGAGPTQSRTVTALGGGLDYHLFGKVWMRADYEHQSWADYHTTTGAALNPDGFTFGVTYHFGRRNKPPAPAQGVNE